MTDIREQVKNALMTVTKNVKMSKPSGDVELPLICYAETSNVSVNIIAFLFFSSCIELKLMISKLGVSETSQSVARCST